MGMNETLVAAIFLAILIAVLAYLRVEHGVGLMSVADSVGIKDLFTIR